MLDLSYLFDLCEYGVPQVDLTLGGSPSIGGLWRREGDTAQKVKRRANVIACRKHHSNSHLFPSCFSTCQHWNHSILLNLFLRCCVIFNTHWSMSESPPRINWILFFIYLLFIFLIFYLFRATHLVYRGSQARGLIGATTSSLCHSHSNTGSEPCLWHTPQLTATPDS